MKLDKVHVYFGNLTNNIKLATFDTMKQGEKFVKNVVKAMQLKHYYIRKTIVSFDNIQIDYGHYNKVFIVTKEKTQPYK